MEAKELAKITCDAINEAAKKVGADVFDIHIFLQEDMPGMYGVYCDRSYGGTKIAEEAVRKELPNALFALDGEDPYREFKEALEEVHQSYDWCS